MKRHLPLAAALLLLLCLPLPALAQTRQSADEAAIRRVVRLYVEGVKNNDAESLKQALHPEGKWFFPSPTQDLKEVRQGRVVENTRGSLKKSIRTDDGGSRIVSLDVTNDVAVVKVELDLPHSYTAGNESDTTAEAPGVRQTDYLSLMRLAGGWKIVGKVSTLGKLSGAGQRASR